MLHRCFFAVLLALVCGSVLPARLPAQTPRTRRELITLLQDALDRRDPQSIENLYYWEDVSREIRVLHRDMFRTLAASHVDSVSFSPLTADYETEIMEDGRRYTLNLPVRGLITISLYDDVVDKPGTITIPYGQVGRNFYLAGLVQDDSGTSRANFYTISVQSLLFPEPVHFKGIYVYEKDGRQERQRFEGDGFFKETIEADVLRACVVRAEADTGWVSMSIRENGMLLWEGRKAESTDALMYHREP